MSTQTDEKIEAGSARKSLSDWPTIRKPASIGFPTPSQPPYLSNPDVSSVLAEQIDPTVVYTQHVEAGVARLGSKPILRQ